MERYDLSCGLKNKLRDNHANNPRYGTGCIGDTHQSAGVSRRNLQNAQRPYAYLGISFVLLDMHQPGVTVKPIRMISGASPFCETFFTDAVATRDDLIGELNRGWTVGKRLLQFERIASSTLQLKTSENPYAQIARQYFGEADGRILDNNVRERIARQTMLERTLALTVQRVTQESRSGSPPGPATSIFKLVGSTASRQGASLNDELRGTAGIGWGGDGFTNEEIESRRAWLDERAATIYSGTNEIQLNIIAKRVLGLPD